MDINISRNSKRKETIHDKFEHLKYTRDRISTDTCMNKRKLDWNVKTYEEWINCEKKSISKLHTMKMLTRHLLLAHGISFKQFKLLFLTEKFLHKFMLKNKSLTPYQIRNYLRIIRHKMSKVYKSAQTPLIPRWIKLTTANIITSLSETILIFCYETYIIFYDVISHHRYIYNTAMNSNRCPSIIAAPSAHIKRLMFAYAEYGDEYPPVYIIEFPSLRTICILNDILRGAYCNLNFVSKNTLITLKNTNNARFVYNLCLWNCLTAEKLASYEPGYSDTAWSHHMALSYWNESIGLGVVMQSCFKIKSSTNDREAVLYCSIFRDHSWKDTSTIYRTETFYSKALVPKDLCVTNKNIYILNEHADLYKICHYKKSDLCLLKKWVTYRPYRTIKLKIELRSYQKGLLIYGPDGILKFYNQKRGKCLCSWWIDVFQLEIVNVTVCGDKCYAVCPEVGILVLKKKAFIPVFEFEEIKVRDLILVQPKCKYLLIVDTRSKITVYDIKTGFKLKVMTFPKKFDDFPYIVNPSFPYIVFISIKVGQLFIFDVESIWNPYIVDCINIGLEKINTFTFSNDGLFTSICTDAKVKNNHIMVIVKDERSSYNFKKIIKFSSASPAKLCSYTDSFGQMFLLAMKNANPETAPGNEVLIWEYPIKYVGKFFLSHNFEMLYSLPYYPDVLFGMLKEKPIKWLKFSLQMTKVSKKSIYQVGQTEVEFFLPKHFGKFELLFTNTHILSYGLEDGVIEIYDPHAGLDKCVFECQIHSSKWFGDKHVHGGIKIVLADEYCTKIVTYGHDNVLMKHRFSMTDQYRRDPRDLYFGTIRTPSWKRKIFCDFFKWDYSFDLDEYKSLELWTKCQVSEKISEDSLRKDEVVLKGSNWRKCIKTPLTVSIENEHTPEVSRPATPPPPKICESAKVDIVYSRPYILYLKMYIASIIWWANFEISQLIKEYLSMGKAKVEPLLLLMDQEYLMQYELSLHYATTFLDLEMKKRLQSLVLQLKTWLKLFREPYHPSKIIRGMVDPKLALCSIGTKYPGIQERWQMKATLLWFTKSELSCFYSKTPILPGLQPTINKSNEEIFITTFFNDSFETVHIENTSFERKRHVDYELVYKMFTSSGYLHELPDIIIRFIREEVINNRKLKPYEFRAFWRQLCKKRAAIVAEGLAKYLENFKDPYTREVLENTFSVRKDIVCQNCQGSEIYPNCKHIPKCSPRSHRIRCPLFMYKFPDATFLLRSLNVPPSVLWQSLRHFNHFKYKFHQNVKNCTLFTDALCPVSVPKKYIEDIKICDDFDKNTYFNAPPNSLVDADELQFSCKIRWDSYLLQLCEVCDYTYDTDMELLLRKLYFECPSRFIRHNKKRLELLELYKDVWQNNSFYPLNIYMLMPWLNEILLELNEIKENNVEEHENLLRDYPQILSNEHKFFVPDWIQDLMDLITEARLEICEKLAKLYVTRYRRRIYRKRNDLQSSDESETLSTDSAGDQCDYEKPPFFKQPDFETYRYQHSKIRHLLPTDEDDGNIEIYNEGIKKQIVSSLNENSLVCPSKNDKLRADRDLNISLITEPLRIDDIIRNKYNLCSYYDYQFLHHPLAGSHKQLIPKYDICTWTAGAGICLACRFLKKCNIHGKVRGLHDDDSEENLPNQLQKQLTYSNEEKKNLKLYPYCLVPPCKPGHRWKPITLKILMNTRKPYPMRYLPFINELLKTMTVHEILPWIKSFVQIIYKIQDKIVNIFSDFNLERLYDEHCKGYLNSLKTPVTIVFTKLETVELIALLAHKISIIRDYIITYTNKILKIFFMDNIFDNNPLKYEHVTRKRIAYYAIKLPGTFSTTPRFDERYAKFKLLKKRDYICYDNIFYTPEGFLKKIAFDNVQNTKYLLRMFIYNKLLTIIRDEYKSIPKHKINKWFKLKPFNYDAPNWELILLTGVASQIFCSCMSNISSALFTFIDENKLPAPTYIRKEDKFVPILKTYQDKHEIVLLKPLYTFEGKSLFLPTLTNDEVRNFRDRHLSNLAKVIFDILQRNKRMADREDIVVKRRDILENIQSLLDVNDELTEYCTEFLMYMKSRKKWLELFLQDPMKGAYPPTFILSPPDMKTCCVVEIAEKLLPFTVICTPYEVTNYEPQHEEITFLPKKTVSPVAVKVFKKAIEKKVKILSPEEKLVNFFYGVLHKQFDEQEYIDILDYFGIINCSEVIDSMKFIIYRLICEKNLLYSDLRLNKYHLFNTLTSIDAEIKSLHEILVCYCSDFFFEDDYGKDWVLYPEEKRNLLYVFDSEENIYTESGNLKVFHDEKIYDFEECEIKFSSRRERDMNEMLDLSFENIAAYLHRFNCKKPEFIEKKKPKNYTEDEKIMAIQYYKKLNKFRAYRSILADDCVHDIISYQNLKELLKHYYDYTIVYHSVYQTVALDNALRIEQFKINSLLKRKMEVTLVMRNLNQIRSLYENIYIEYIYLRSRYLLSCYDYEMTKRVFEKLADTYEPLQYELFCLLAWFETEYDIVEKTLFQDYLEAVTSQDILKPLPYKVLKHCYGWYVLNKLCLHSYKNLRPEFQKYYGQIRNYYKNMIFEVDIDELRNRLINIVLCIQFTKLKHFITGKQLRYFHYRLSPIYALICCIEERLKLLKQQAKVQLELLNKVLFNYKMTVTHTCDKWTCIFDLYMEYLRFSHLLLLTTDSYNFSQMLTESKQKSYKIHDYLNAIKKMYAKDFEMQKQVWFWITIKSPLRLDGQRENLMVAWPDKSIEIVESVMSSFSEELVYPSRYSNVSIPLEYKPVTTPPPTPDQEIQSEPPEYTVTSDSDESTTVFNIKCEHDWLIHEYLRKQIVKLLSEFKHEDIVMDDEVTLEKLEMNFKFWIQGLFENVYIPPLSIDNLYLWPSVENYCNVPDFTNRSDSYTHTEASTATKASEFKLTVELYLHILITKHASSLKEKNIPEPDEKLNMLITEDWYTMKCFLYVVSKMPRYEEEPLTTADSGEEVQLVIKYKPDPFVFKDKDVLEVEDNHINNLKSKIKKKRPHTLTDEKNLLILELIKLHKQKFNKNIYFPPLRLQHADDEDAEKEVDRFVELKTRQKYRELMHIIKNTEIKKQMFSKEVMSLREAGETLTKSLRLMKRHCDTKTKYLTRIMYNEPLIRQIAMMKRNIIQLYSEIKTLQEKYMTTLYIKCLLTYSKR